MRFFFFYFKQRRAGTGVFILFSIIFICVFALYHLPVEAVLYPAGICATLGAGYLLFDFQKAFRKHKKLQKLQEMTAAVMEDFPEAVTQDDIDYQQLIQQLREEQRQLENQMSIRYADMVEYYTIWAHQIKTPIASMRLHLQNEDSSFSRRLSDDLFRIEQYVEMVLMFLRLDSASTDYVIQEYDLDRIVKQAVKKYASQFINKKIQLRYHPLNTTVLTDEKWLLFVLEQVLSNALKYTPSGSVAIDLESHVILASELPQRICLEFLKRATQDITEEAIKKPVVLDFIFAEESAAI